MFFSPPFILHYSPDVFIITYNFLFFKSENINYQIILRIFVEFFKFYVTKTDLFFISKRVKSFKNHYMKKDGKICYANDSSKRKKFPLFKLDLSDEPNILRKIL